MKRIYHYTVLFIFSLFTAHVATAHNGSIRGIVYSAGENRPMEGAVILINGSTISTTSNAFGVWDIEALPAAKYSIEIIYLGYASGHTEAEVLEGKVTLVETFLEAAPISMDAVLVRAGTDLNRNAIQAIDMQMRPTQSAQDLLRMVPGLFIAQHAGGGKAEQIFLRGFDIDHGTDISVNVDGIPVNMVSHAHGQGYADLHFLIPETVQEAEFEKGPYDPKYGDFTTAGYVNFRTVDVLNGSRAEISAGQFNTARIMTMLDLFQTKDANGTHAAYLAGELYTSDGPFISPQDYLRSNIFFKYHAHLNRNTMLSLSASAFSSEWNASGQIPQRAVDSGIIDRFGSINDTEGGNTGRNNINLEYIKLPSANTALTQQVYFSTYRFELYSDFTFFLTDSVQGDMIKQKENRKLFGYKGTFSSEGNLSGLPTTHEAGYGFRFDNSDENELSRVADRNTLLERLAYGNINQLNAYAWFSETLQLTGALQLQAAVRYDHFNFGYDDLTDSVYAYQSADAGLPSFKLNLHYAIGNDAVLYLQGGTGFHSNDARVAVNAVVAQTLPAAYGSDLGFKWKTSDKLFIQPALWVLYLEQEFVYVGDAAVVEPGGKTFRRGADLSIRWQPVNWLFFDADINYTLATALGEPEHANYIPLAPDLTSIGGINLRLNNGLSGSLRYRYMDDRPANEDNSVIAEGYFVNDLVAQYDMQKMYFGVEIQNLFNVEWNEAQFDTESRLQNEAFPVSELHFTPGTSFFLKLKAGYRF